MKSFKLSSVVALLILALMLTACASTPSEGDVESSGSEQSELPSSSVKPSESDKPDSQLPSQSEDETEPLEDGWTRLTEDELKWFNEQFFNVENNKIVNYFLNNMFGSVETISINYLFENEPLPEIEITDAEKSALAKTPIDMELDIHKIPVEYMNTILKTYANITLEETRKVGEDDLIYLKEYAAYYVATGDYAYTTYTMESGQRYEDGTIKLQYQHEIEYARCEVTLKPHDNGYYFLSNLIIR